MTTWMTNSEKEQLISATENSFGGGLTTVDAVLQTKMALETLEIQSKAAYAEERAAIATEIAANASVKNAKYMLWSVIAAAVSAMASLASTIISVLGHH